MTPADVSRIENELGISLPEPYRRAALAFPVPELAGNSDTDFWDDAGQVIKLNTGLRRRGGWPEGWPKEMFAFGKITDPRF